MNLTKFSQVILCYGKLQNIMKNGFTSFFLSHLFIWIYYIIFIFFILKTNIFKYLAIRIWQIYLFNRLFYSRCFLKTHCILYIFTQFYIIFPTYPQFTGYILSVFTVDNLYFSKMKKISNSPNYYCLASMSTITSLNYTNKNIKHNMG